MKMKILCSVPKVYRGTLPVGRLQALGGKILTIFRVC
ncbi:MAG: hypothetical protein BWY40_00511 [bacterium ADurb.Bin270]|nr:MAG: hypothetical protein BWY40_00511 [bacterium ADurb.Bin270]